MNTGLFKRPDLGGFLAETFYGAIIPFKSDAVAPVFRTRSMRKKDSNRNISRIEIQNSKGGYFSGWEVRIQRRGKQVHKFFNDKKFGGSKFAFKAACEFRDEIEAKLKPFTLAERSKRPSKRNTSGTVGVRRQQQVDVRDGSEYNYEYWIAQWTDEAGRRVTQSFSVRELGEQKARRLALEARKNGIKSRDE